MTAGQWKEFYRREREALGEAGLLAMLDRAAAVQFDKNGAIIFPHTRLSQSGRLVAAVAKAVVESGCDTVLALGVLHGAREQDAPLVQAARAGDRDAIAVMRRVHGPGVAGDEGRWYEEFSLDNFAALLDIAARARKKKPPRLIARYPFASALTDKSPRQMPEFEELARLIDDGACLVATTDPIHHGHGYQTPADQLLLREAESTRAWARREIEGAFRLLSQHHYPGFLSNAMAVRSDFRDVGPVLAELVELASARIVDLELVDYADVLDAPQPTWVAAALVTT